MDELLIAAGASFGLAGLLTPWVRDLAFHLRLVDEPDGRRKLHGRCTPVVGGPILLLSAGIALLLTFLRPGALSARVETNGDHLVGLLAAALVICVVGVLDDFGRLRGRHKLLGQLLAVSVVIASGVRIDTLRLFDINFELGLLAVPFTLFFLLGAINSLNLLDGMDGLLTSVALITCVSFGTIALTAGKDATACVAFALAGSLLAFLWFNFPPATVFLGDSGSMVIGLAIGVVAIDSSLKRPATAALATPAALLTLPIFDTVAAILRRKLTGRSIYSTDRGHLHHCLLRHFIHPRRVLLILAACCLTTAVGAIAGELLGSDALVLLSSGSVVTVLIATRLFGHAELMLVARRLGGGLRSSLRLRRRGEVREIEVRLQGTGDWRELWQRLTASAVALNLCRVHLGVNAPAWGEGYHASWDRGSEVREDEGGQWRALLPVAVHGCTIGQLEVAGRHDGEPVEDKITRLARLLRDFSFAGSLPAEGNPPPPVHRSTPLPPTLRPGGQEQPDLQQAQA